MPDSIIYCDRCSRIVLPSQLEDGQAVRVGEASYCADCWAAFSPEQREAVERAASAQAGTDAPAAGPPPVRRRAPARGVPAKPSAAGRSVVIVSVAGGLLLGVLITVAVLSTPEPSGRSADAPGVGPAPFAAPAPAPARADDEAARGDTAAADLRRIRESLDASPGRYAESRRRLESFASSHRGSSVAAEATALLTRLDREYATAAENALAAAASSARAAAVAGDAQRAEQIIREAAERYDQGSWLATDGTRMVEEAIASLPVKAAVRPKATDDIEEPRLGDGPIPDEIRARYDELMLARAYGEAADHVRGEASTSRASLHGNALRAAARVAASLAARPAAMVAGARARVGKAVALNITTGSIEGELVEVDGERLVVSTTFVINGQERRKTVSVSWASLTRRQRDDLAYAGGWKAEARDGALGAAYEALAAGDLDECERRLRAAKDHLLARGVSARLATARNDARFAASMRQARAAMARKSYSAAAKHCRAALVARPGDPEATKLLERARTSGPRPAVLVRTSVERFESAGPTVDLFTKRGDATEGTLRISLPAGPIGRASAHLEITMHDWDQPGEGEIFFNGHRLAISTDKRSNGADFVFRFEPLDISWLKTGAEPNVLRFVYLMSAGFIARKAAIVLGPPANVPRQ